MKVREWIARHLDKVQEAEESRVLEIEQWAKENPEFARYLYHLEMERLKNVNCI